MENSVAYVENFNCEYLKAWNLNQEYDDSMVYIIYFSSIILMINFYRLNLILISAVLFFLT